MDDQATHGLMVTDWEEALASGWRVRDPAGRWNVQNGILRLHVDDGDADRWLELSSPDGLRVGGDFALEVSLRFLAIGTMDDDTHEASNLTLELGTGEPLNLGMRILLLGDRYMVDVDRSPLQYIIFRSAPGQWHRWRFEVRASRRQVALIRDDEYVCLHALHGERSPGLRAQVRGTAEVPTVVEVGEVSLLSLPAEPEEEQPEPPPQETIRPGEWPMFRRDRANSAHSPLVGGWGGRPPVVAWSYPLGGWDGDVYMADCNGDGQHEILIAFAGSLAAYRPDGVCLWKRSLDAPMMYGLWDLDEDGRLELTILAGTPRHVEILDGATGATRYACTYDTEYEVLGLRVSKLDPARRGLQMVVWSAHEIGYCLGFDEGVANGRVLWTYNYEHFNFTPEVAFADMDRDGLLEVVLATYNSFFVYDGRSGAVKMALAEHLGRNYGLLSVTDVDGDGYPDIVMQAEQLREHVCVARNEGGRSLRLLWNRFYEQNYPVDQKELRTLPGSVGDWDGDGHAEILYGVYDETDGDIWRTLLVDALTGECKASLERCYPVTLDTLADGTRVAYLAEITGRGERLEVATRVTATDRVVGQRLRAFSFQGGTPYLLAELPAGFPVLDRSWRAFPENEWAMYADVRAPRLRQGQHGLYLVSAQDDHDRVVRFVQMDARGTAREAWRCVLPRDLPSGKVLDVCEGYILYAGSDATLYLLDERGESLHTFPGGGMIGYPIVADLGAGPRLSILVNDSRERLLCLAPGPDGRPPTLRWQAPSVGAFQSWHAEQGLGMPLAVDLDQDGAKEVVVGQPPQHLSVLDAEGQVKWTKALPAKPTYWTHGNFTGRRRFDLYVSYATGPVEARSSVLRMDGEGKPMWEFACGTGTPAVLDFDRDGREDVVTRDLFWRHTLDGMKGRDLFPVTQWAGYHVPIIARGSEFKDGTAILWVGGNYSLVAETWEGEQMWWKPFMSRWHPGAVADVDGDGWLEVGAPTWGQVYHWPAPFDPVPGLGRAFVCLEAATGAIKWTYDPGSAMSGAVVADVDGDGLPEFVFGTADGRLIALRGGADEERRVAFSVQLPAALGMPVICDPVGQGEMHILVGCADGNLYALR